MVPAPPAPPARACIPRAHALETRSLAAKSLEPRGLGGNTKGSEGYGELTQGSLSRLWALLAHLRSTVLRRLHTGQWSRLFDLRSDASLCDVGSGYGKVVMHYGVVFSML